MWRHPVNMDKMQCFHWMLKACVFCTARRGHCTNVNVNLNCNIRLSLFLQCLWSKNNEFCNEKYLKEHIISSKYHKPVNKLNNNCISWSIRENMDLSLHTDLASSVCTRLQSIFSRINRENSYYCVNNKYFTSNFYFITSHIPLESCNCNVLT